MLSPSTETGSRTLPRSPRISSSMRATSAIRRAISATEEPAGMCPARRPLAGSSVKAWLSPGAASAGEPSAGRGSAAIAQEIAAPIIVRRVHRVIGMARGIACLLSQMRALERQAVLDRLEPVGVALVGAAHGRRGHGERKDGVRRRVGHFVQRLQADVAEIVAGEVVARIVLFTGGATIDRNFLVALDPLGAGEQAAGRDADGDEGPVIR